MRSFVGFGSNLGDREALLASALGELERHAEFPALVSSVYETEPVGSLEPLPFLNLVARLDTHLSPLELLDLLLALERRAGRTRGESNAPRTLDLDLLLAGDLRSDGARLVLPHPRMWERRFVMEPLAEIAPGVRDPATGRTALEVCRALPERPWVRKLGPLPRSLPAPGV